MQGLAFARRWQRLYATIGLSTFWMLVTKALAAIIGFFAEIETAEQQLSFEQRLQRTGRVRYR